MRRKDREITDPEQIYDMIQRCTCCRIGFNDDGEVYIVPLNFGFEVKDDQYVFYFHGAKEGRKLGLIQKNPQVGFELDTDHAVYSLHEDAAACHYTARFQSIIGNGTVSIVSDPEEKMHGLTLLMEHNTGKTEWHFDEKMLHAVAVFKLEVTSLSCKQHD